ncbi:hypothetical protein UNDKW_0092 [Undibacterium sp. KW1]|uniref:hypothetical protein n=1 Tax=Undibacterium sp. KW1 TaxID=2058624 RepID=UPI001331EA63|nr:hypothetical protein [Undibacterium sp. KW1]BBB58365.1 hypothetical protein UNDKW_0092 [Undibacterium sp. KW1]
MSDPKPPVNYTFTTYFNQGIPQSRATVSAHGKFSPVLPTDTTTGRPYLCVGDTVTFNFVGTPTNPQDTVTVTASAFIAICKGKQPNGESNVVGTSVTACPVDGATMTMSADSIGFWGFTISFSADFKDSSGNVISSEFFYLPDPEVDVESGSGG